MARATERSPQPTFDVSMLRAVIYDLDGTLVDSEADNVEVTVRVLARMGRAATAPERAFVVGHSWNEIFAQLKAHHNLTARVDEFIAAAVRERETLIRANGIRELPGARTVPRRLASHVAQTVVSGSSRDEIEMSLRALHLDEVITWFVGAEDYSRGKPSPEPFQTALARLGFRADECLVVEDTRDGIASARAAGMRVIAVRAGCTPGQDQSAADAIVDTLLDVEAIVLKELRSTV